MAGKLPHVAVARKVLGTICCFSIFGWSGSAFSIPPELIYVWLNHSVKIDGFLLSSLNHTVFDGAYLTLSINDWPKVATGQSQSFGEFSIDAIKTKSALVRLSRNNTNPLAGLWTYSLANHSFPVSVFVTHPTYDYPLALGITTDPSTPKPTATKISFQATYTNLEFKLTEAQANSQSNSSVYPVLNLPAQACGLTVCKTNQLYLVYPTNPGPALSSNISWTKIPNEPGVAGVKLRVNSADARATHIEVIHTGEAGALTYLVDPNNDFWVKTEQSAVLRITGTPLSKHGAPFIAAASTQTIMGNVPPSLENDPPRLL